MTEETLPVAHHEFGPSKLENYDPRSGGCAAFMPDGQENEKAAHGTLKHVALATRDFSILGGDERAVAEVARVAEFIETKSVGYPEHHSELTLHSDRIFGTLDFLAIDGARALIIDAKFGVWSVTPARKNLQGWAYVMLTFNNYPQIKKIRLVFYAAKFGTFTEHTFYRYQLPVIEKRIYRIIDRALQVKETPVEKDYTPHPVNCSFCVRLNCPSRLALMGTLVSVWTQKPVALPHLDLLQVSTPQLADLKRLSNAFKKFSEAVDSEAKRRAFDEGDVIEGYEISERQGTRTVIGAEKITQASKLLALEWDQLGFAAEKWGDFIAENAELSVSGLEKEIVKRAPKGKGELAKRAIINSLKNACLVNASSVFYLSAIKE